MRTASCNTLVPRRQLGIHPCEPGIVLLQLLGADTRVTEEDQSLISSAYAIMGKSTQSVVDK
jgi:hypothetical protein